MTITTELRVLTAESDIPELARVKAAAFKDSPFHIAMYPVKDEKAMLAFYDARERQAFLNPRRTIVAVVDSNSKELTILAWARWLIPLAIINKQRAVSGESPLLYTVDSVSKTRAEAPEGANIAFRTAFLDWCYSLHQTHGINDEEDYGKLIRSSIIPRLKTPNNITIKSSSTLQLIRTRGVRGTHPCC